MKAPKNNFKSKLSVPVLFLVIIFCIIVFTKKNEAAIISTHRNYPNLKTTARHPETVRAGEIISCTIELRNEGTETLRDISCVVKLPAEIDFMIATDGYIYYDIADWIDREGFIFIPMLLWNFSEISSMTTKELSFIGKVRTNLQSRTKNQIEVYIMPKDWANKRFPVYYPYGDHD